MQSIERIVAISIWESQETFNQALPAMATAIANVPFQEWEARQRELIQSTEAQT